MFFEIFSDECKEGISESRANESIDNKFGQIHFPHARRKRDKMSHHRDKSTDQNSNTSFFFEKMFGRC